MVADRSAIMATTLTQIGPHWLTSVQLTEGSQSPFVTFPGALMYRLLTASLLGVVLAGPLDSAEPEVLSISQRVDQLLAERWAKEGVKPAARSGDSEFVRRVHLDLVGVIPQVSDVRSFLADGDPAKRAKLIDRLLDSPRHATHMANTWRQIMLPGGGDFQQLQSVSGVQNWLRRQFSANVRYDRFVSDFLVASGGGSSGPALYYTSLELEPKRLAASTSRIFLGLQIECAECHDHPFDHWTQQDFWGYAAFFAQLDRSGAMNGPGQTGLVDLDEGDVTLPDTETVVLPKYPAGRGADPSDGGTRRVQLAIWMASRDNPYLPRAAVNRVWAHLFGRGLVEPVDDLGEHNPPSHPLLMDHLVDFLIGNGFDTRALFRVLVNTDAYQLSSEIADEPPAGELFASMAVKTMTADQLYDCLARVLLRAESGTSAVPAQFGGIDPRRIAFVSKMQMRGANATEFEAGVLQALTMLNGSQTAAMTDFERSGLLQALQAPWMTDAARVDNLFLAVVARFPAAEEREEFVEYVAEGGARGAQEHAISDLLWALLNSAEFQLNH
jgi:hypothetical protein